MATIKDVAKAAGVGTGTVSRALSGNCRAIRVWSFSVIKKKKQ